MELLLVTIASVSLLVALATGLALWSVLNGERQRSAARARVALLRAAAPDPSAPALTEEPTPAHDAASSTRAEMFAPWGTTSSSWSSQGRAVAIAVALCATVAVFLALLLQGSPGGTTAGIPAAGAGPLELLALRHTPDEEGLTISGIARNPAGSPRLADVVVVTSVHGTDGREVGNGRAALEHAVLEPGATSLFVIKVPVGGAVSRYRIGFRGADGAVLAHVDRRSDVASRSHGTTGGSRWVP